MEQTYVRINDDRTQAWLYLGPKADETSYTKEELKAILEQNGVKAGFNESNLAAMAKKEVYGREICVAQKIAPVDGKDGYYEYGFECNYKRMPKIREDGSVDYTSMNMIQSVKKGTLLARYHKAVAGTDGMDVCGNVIVVARAKELPPLKGAGIERSTEDDAVYQASRDGKIEFSDGKISISNVFTVNQDVDRNTGKVEFDGDLVIQGNVGSGVIIRAEKSLTIEGTVEAAQLFAGGDIILKRGIQGNNKAVVTAGGDVYGDFIELAEIKAEGNVEANSIVNAQIYAQGKVKLTGKKGRLLGGYTHATKGISCKQLGNDVEVKTVVHVGCEKELMQLFSRQNKEIGKLKEVYDSAKDDFNKLLQMKLQNKQLSTPMEKKLHTLGNEIKELVAQLEEVQEKQSICAGRIQAAKGAVVRIEGKFYRGVVIGIDQVVLSIEENDSFMEYRNISGMIAGNVVALN